MSQSTSTPRLRGPRVSIAKIENALEAARMERASFRKPGPDGRETWPLDQPEYTAEIRDATRLYRESWIIGPLEAALAELRGEAPLEDWDAHLS